MNAEQTVALYYRGPGRNRLGDFSDVPFADDSSVVGPVTSFDTAASYREMASQTGHA